MNRITFVMNVTGLIAFLPGVASAEFIPPNLPPGSQYQLIFVTAEYRDQTSTQIADYNTFVTSQAQMNPSLPHGVMWHAVLSRSSINANVNAPSLGLPVFNTRGDQVASEVTGLYSAPLLHSVSYNQFGGEWAGARIVTNSTVAGDWAGPAGALADATETSDKWINAGTYPSNFSIANLQPFYALSSPITVPIPEPSSVVLAILGFACFVASTTSWNDARLSPRRRLQQHLEGAGASSFTS